MTTTIDGSIVYEQRDTDEGTERITHTCATRRVAQILAIELELRDAGWTVRGLASSDQPRRPLILAGEAMCWPLDGRRSDERAQGFSARRSPDVRGTDVITVDACAGLPLLVLAERGDTAEARRIIEWHLGPLS